MLIWPFGKEAEDEATETETDAAAAAVGWAGRGCLGETAGDGGTPLLLDDALGYSDPERLRLMGAVLAKAAKECQIVIFTCVPDRYSNIGEATVVAIG